MGQPMRETGVFLLDVSARPTTQPHTERSRGQRLLQLGIAGGDLVLITVATALAAIGRTSLDVFNAANDVNVVAQSVGLWIVAAWMVANLLVGSYTSSTLGVGTLEYTRVCSAAGLTAGAIGIASYLTKFNLSRGFFVLIFLVGVPMLLVWRWSARRLVHRAHARGHLLTRVVISGTAGSLSFAANASTRWPTLAAPKPGMCVCMYGRSWAPWSRIFLTYSGLSLAPTPSSGGGRRPSSPISDRGRRC